MSVPPVPRAAPRPWTELDRPHSREPLPTVPEVIPFVEVKRPRYERVASLLGGSEASGVWTNFGPVSLQLEATVARMLALPAARRVVACANGTVALHGLVHLYEHLRGRPLRWVVSAFTFHAQRQGPLAAARVVDCDPRGGLDLDELARISVADYDGIVVTNLFGAALPIERYQEIAIRGGKVLLFDSATCFGTTYRGEPLGGFGDGELFSFHHTKPCGFGEGGCAVVPAELEETFRSLLNFGLYKGIDTGPRSANGKMADVAAAFILDRLDDFAALRTAHRQQFRRIARMARNVGGKPLVDCEDAGAFPSLMPLVFPRPVPVEKLAGRPVVLHKYYRPLAARPVADALYGRVACFPCHPGVAALADEELGAALSAISRE